MSIYATLWQLKFPRYGDDHTGCDWIAVMAQGVPAHVGAPPPGADGREEDPYAAFLPPVGAAPHDDDGQAMRAVVFVAEGTPKGTARSPQEYVRPLLVLSGQEYATIAFRQLHRMICLRSIPRRYGSPMMRRRGLLPNSCGFGFTGPSACSSDPSVAASAPLPKSSR